MKEVPDDISSFSLTKMMQCFDGCCRRSVRAVERKLREREGERARREVHRLIEKERAHWKRVAEKTDDGKYAMGALAALEAMEARLR